MDELTSLSNLSADTVINRLTTAGVSNRDAALIASAWIYQNIAWLGRTFAYGAPFPETDPTATSSFAETFHHRDWTDGEDVVQAAPSATDDGFNGRFQKIQADIAALGAEIAKIYTTIAEMRSNLSDRLQEISVELNRIDSDIAPRHVPFREAAPVSTFGGLVGSTRLIGLSTVAEQPVSLWDTDHGVMVLPTIGQPAGDPSTDPGVKNASALAGFASGGDVQNAFAGKAFSPADFVTKFGSTTLSTGAKISDVIANLPSTAQFASVNDLVAAVGEQQSRSLTMVPGVPSVFAPAVAAAAAQPAPAPAAPGDASINTVSSIPADQRAALSAQGINTVAQLATADPNTVSMAFTKAGITNVDLADIVAHQQTAKIITQIHALQ